MRSFFTKIVGVSFENENGSARQELIAELESVPCALSLVRECDNPHDNNAIAVFDTKGRQLGYLSRHIADQMSKVMDAGIHVQAHVMQVTGGWPLHYGVNIKVIYPW